MCLFFISLSQLEFSVAPRSSQHKRFRPNYAIIEHNMKRPVADNSTYYRDVMRVLRISGTLLPLVVVPVGLLIQNGLLDDRFYINDTWYGALSIAFIFIAVLQYFLTRYRPTPENYLALSVSYHVLGAAFILTVSGFLSPAIICWIALMLAVDTYFGTIAFVLSSMVLVGVGFASLQLYEASPEQYVLVALYCLFIIAVGFTVSRIRSVTDRERYALTKSREDENFQRERLITLVNSMGDAVVTTDEEGNIKIFNAATLNLLDTNVSLTNKRIDRVLHLYDEDGKRVNAVELASAKKVVFSRTDLVHKFKDGEQMNLYINFSPIQLSYQGAGDKGFIFILRDITKEKSLEEERDEFISVVSHELRTPVAIVEGTISNLRILQSRGADPTVLNHSLEDAHEQIMYLAKMINDLSTLSRAERGLDSAVEEIDPNEFLHELYKSYIEAAQKKGLKLDIDIQPRLPRITTSRLYLEEILQNFLTNAIKYTKEGSVTIIGHKARGGVYFAVRDSGIGISKSDQRHIFEKFYRSEDYRTRETSGTGLGLYVTRKLAGKMGVDVEFESRLNHGSTFSFVVKSDKSKDKD
jgi:PAS domain S-box-containing protein